MTSGALATALAATAVLATMLVGSAAGSASADRIQRLPRVTGGKLLPSAGGVVLGKTTKPELLARWGPATQCNPDPSSCTWVVGLGKNFFPEPGGVSDSMLVTFHPSTRRALTLSLSTSKWQKSRLRGWKLPRGLGIGSPFPDVRRAYPTVRWSSGVATMRDGSVWLVMAHEHASSLYRLKFTVDAGAARAASGHVFGLEIIRLLPRVTCRLAVEEVPPPADAAAGKRVRGSCGPATEYAADWGRAFPLRVSFSAVGGTQITSATSPFDPGCSPDGCQSRASDWAVDVTLGVTRPSARLEAIVDLGAIPNRPEGPSTLRIGLG